MLAPPLVLDQTAPVESEAHTAPVEAQAVTPVVLPELTAAAAAPRAEPEPALVRAEPPRVEPAPSAPFVDVEKVLQESGLVMIKTDPSKVKPIEPLAETPFVRAQPRPRRPPPPDTGPLQIVETRKNA
ncbi:MAG: hypothetical protein ABIH03_10835 [Pseudomonadota bacterium]